VTNLVWGTLIGNGYYFEVYQSPMVKALSIYPYTNYMFPCPIRWLKYSEIYRITGTRSAVWGSCPLVKEGCMFCPLPRGPWNTTPVRTILRARIITWPRVVSPAHILFIGCVGSLPS
jgi:hypothetical protein